MEPGEDPDDWIQFQSAPDQLIGRYMPGAQDIAIGIVFQSAPDQLIGRYGRLISDQRGSLGFNPRPTN